MGDVINLTEKQLHERWQAFDDAARAVAHAYIDNFEPTRDELVDAAYAFVNAFDEYTTAVEKAERMKNGGAA